MTQTPPATSSNPFGSGLDRDQPVSAIDPFRPQPGTQQPEGRPATLEAAMNAAYGAAWSELRAELPHGAGTGEAEYVHFALCDQPIDGQKAEDVVGLNWALTRRATAYLAGDAGDPESTRLPDAMKACENEQQLNALKTWFDKIGSKKAQ
jgi:hypothetical protein